MATSVTGMAMSVVTSVYAKMWGEVRCSSAGSSSRAAEPHARLHRCVCLFPDAPSARLPWCRLSLSSSG